MDDPSEEKNPKHGRQDEVDQRDKQAPLDELPEPGYEKAAERGEYVST
jgi:hypothetical protein